jgi:hypothetical protein
MNWEPTVAVVLTWPSSCAVITSVECKDEGSRMVSTMEAVDEQLMVDGETEMLPDAELIFM